MRALACLLVALCGSAAAQETSHAHGHAAATGVVAFEATGAKPFSALMADAMAAMDDAMRRAPMNGQASHDFITMMLPHHQGAIDMAKAMLLHTTDPALRNLCLGIIAEQQNEINLMRAWLAHNAN